MIKDLTARTFSRLTVLSFAFTRSRHAYWLCKCECGKEKYILGSCLTRGTTLSCGCKKSQRMKQYNSALRKPQKFESNENIESYF